MTINKVFRAIESAAKEKRIDNSAEKMALYIVNSGGEITNLLLQKVLYYVKAISKLFEEKSIILEPCEGWKLGSVFPSVYEKYKDFGKQEITINLSDDYVKGLLTEEEKKTPEGIDSYVKDMKKKIY